MKSNTRIFVIASIILLVMVSARVANETPREDMLPDSPAQILESSDGRGLWILEETGGCVDYFSLTDHEITKGVKPGVDLSGMDLWKNYLVLTSNGDGGRIFLFDDQDRRIKKSFKAGPGARSPVVDPIHDLLYTCHTWKDEIGVYDLNRRKLIQTIPVLRQPSVCILSQDGNKLFVANFLTHQRADQDTVASAISVIDTRTMKVIDHIMLANGSNALRGISLSSSGNYVYVTHNLGRFQVPTTQLEQGWMNTSALSVINAKTLKLEGTILLDEPDAGAAGSWGVDAADGHVVVAHSGTHDLSLIDEEAMLNKLMSVPDRRALSYDLNFLSDIRTRILLPGNGPRSVLLVNDIAWTGLYFSDTLVAVTVNNSGRELQSYALNSGFIESDQRLGEKYFHDASHCFQGWQACTGCHPMDARVDGLNWDLLNDGIGNAKNCKSLLFAHVTPPTMITGIRADAETAVRAGFRYIQFSRIEEEQAAKVDVYLKSLRPEPSPLLKNGKLSKKARRGQKVFEKSGCLECHSGEWYTDMKMHTFVSPNDNQGPQNWDTPTLREVWRTGPWMHDGRCSKMREVFTVEHHGLDQQLSEHELDELVEYVLSL